MTGKEIIEQFINPQDFVSVMNDGYNFKKLSFEDFEEIRQQYDVDLEKVISIVGPFEVESDDRDLFDTESSQLVVHFKDHDVYIMIIGYYNSHDGTNYEDADDWVEVEEVEIKVNVWRKKK